MTTHTKAAVQEAVEAFRLAMLSRDPAELDRWTAEELSYGHANGGFQNKKVFVDGVVNDDAPFSEIELADVVVTLFDNLAVVRHGLTRRKPAPNNAPSIQKDMNVWIFRGGTWKLLARQSVRG